ncbi:MAG: hypothetical protein AAGK22_17715 [Acidobacteriota bacterium]
MSNSDHEPFSERELQALWRSGERDTPSGEEVLEDAKRRSRRLTRSLRRRDLRETVAGLFGFGVMAVIALRAPGLVPKVALLLGSPFLLLPVWRLHAERRRHRDLAPDAPLKSQLSLELQRVQGQIDLLLRVARWYVAPLAIGSTIVVTAAASAAPGTPAFRIATAAVCLVGSLLIFGIVGWGVVRLNRHAVENDLEPLRDDLVEALETLREDAA